MSSGEVGDGEADDHHVDTPTGPANRRLLVSVPATGDENFDQTVVLVVEHDDEGALGLVLNRPTPEQVADHLPQLGERLASPPVFFSGGPVGAGGLLVVGRRRLAGVEDFVTPVVGPIVLVQPDAMIEGRVEAVDVIRLFTGYSGWGPGQLDAELAAGGWHLVDPLPDDVFCVDPEGLWRAVMRRQGGRLASQALYPDDLSAN